jgi:NitT/TauT family transport system permease protein
MPRSVSIDAIDSRPGQRRMRIKRLIATVPGLIVTRILILALFLAAWESASGTLISRFWVSSPSRIFATLWLWISSGSLWPHLQATMTAMCIGYVIGCLAGIGLGLLLSFLPTVQRVLMPYISGLYALPKIALAPLFVILLGIDIPSKVALVAITAVFLLLYNTLDGIRDVDPDLVQSLRLMGASRREIVQKALFPATLPWIFTGMRIAVRYSFTATVLGELIAANKGVGYLIEANAGLYNATGVFAGVIVLVTLSVVLTELLTHAEGTKPSSV